MRGRLAGLKESIRLRMGPDRWEALKKFLGAGKFPYEMFALYEVDNEACNFDCEYCCSDTVHTKKQATAIDIEKLLHMLDSTGKIWMVLLCGNGEPFLAPNIVEACEKLTKRHYIGLTSNLSSGKITDLADRVNPRKVRLFIVSAHFRELERYGLVNRFIEHYLLLRKKGFNVWADEVAYPPHLDELERWRKKFAQRGVGVTFREFIGRWDGRNWPDSYTDEQRVKYGFQDRERSLRALYRKARLCNAGLNSILIKNSGDVYPCFHIKDRIGSYKEGIRFNDKLTRCPFDLCRCATEYLDPWLFQRALKERAGDVETGL